MPNAQGIDVSHWSVINDVKAVIAAGYSFVGVKATQGLSFVDPKLVYHRDLVRGEPGMVGAIFYHYPNKRNDPAHEAAFFLDSIGPLRDNERLALDVEQGSSGSDAPPIEWIQEFTAELPQDRGRTAGNYNAAHVWNEIGNPPWPDATVGKIWLWAKQYGPQLTKIASPWSFATLWQKSQSLVVPGVSAPCDVDEFCLGDEDELRRFFALAPA